MTQQTVTGPPDELYDYQPSASNDWDDACTAHALAVAGVTTETWDAFSKPAAATPAPSAHTDYSLRASEVSVQDLSDPTTLKSLIAFAYEGIAKYRVNWVDLDHELQVEIVSRSIRPYIGCRNWTYSAVKLTAEALLKGEHINPPAYLDAVSVPTTPKNPPRATAKERALSRKAKGQESGFDAIPEPLLAKIESDYAVVQAAKASQPAKSREEGDDKAPPRLMTWAARAFAEYMNSTGAGRNGGEATVTHKQAGEAIRRDKQGLSKLFIPNGLMTPWVVSKSRKHQVLPVGKPFVRYCHWWRDDLALNPCGNVNQRFDKDLQVVYDLSGRALEDALVIFILTVQRHAQWDATGANNRRDSMETLARMAGSNVRTMEYAQAEAVRRGWMSSYGAGGFSKPAYRRVHYVPLAGTP